MFYKHFLFSYYNAVSQVTAGPTCYSCKHINGVSECSTVEQCRSDQVITHACLVKYNHYHLFITTGIQQYLKYKISRTVLKYFTDENYGSHTCLLKHSPIFVIVLSKEL